MKNSYHISRYSYLVFIVFLCSVFYVWVVISDKSSSKVEEGSYSGILTSFQIDGDLWSGIVIGEKSYLFYRTIATEKEKKWLLEHVQIGSYFTFDGEKKPIASNGNRILFQMNTYYKTKKVFDQITVTSYHLEDRSIPFRYRMRTKMAQLVSAYQSPYLNAFLFGQLDMLDEDHIEYIRKLGISHLFSISGLHFHVCIFLFHVILKQWIRSSNFRDIVVGTLLFQYGFIVGFSPSVLRVFIFYILTSVCRYFHLSCTSLDRFIMTLSIILFLNPYLIFHVGFQFSFGITFLLLYDRRWLSLCRFAKYILPFYIFLFSFPISIFHWYEVNFLSPVYNLIFVPLVSMILFPLALLTFLIPLFLPIFQMCISIFESLLCYCGEIPFGIFSFARPSFFWIVIYYILFFGVRKMVFQGKYSYILIFIFMIGCHYMKLWFCSDMQYHVLDVGQGDASIFVLPHQTSAIMVDTGGRVSFSKKGWQKRKKQTSLTEKILIPYLKSIGVHHIRFLILSHGDLDHMGESISLVNQFQVDQVILNCGEYNDLEKKLQKVLKQKNVPYNQCVKELRMNAYALQFLNTKIYENENDNSSVVYFSYQGVQFLLMGDAGIGKEKDILNRYDLEGIDFLKVGHHGSSSSSSKEFIHQIQPRYSLISVGKNNRYGHPKESVLDILKNSKIYRTDLDGSIEIQIHRRGYQIETGRS